MIGDNYVVGDNAYLKELHNFFFRVLGMMSITHYGCIGDGRTDNYAPLQVAIDDAKRRGLSFLYVPMGRYIYAGTLNNLNGLIFIGNPHAKIINIRTGYEHEIKQFGWYKVDIGDNYFDKTIIEKLAQGEYTPLLNNGSYIDLSGDVGDTVDLTPIQGANTAYYTETLTPGEGFDVIGDFTYVTLDDDNKIVFKYSGYAPSYDDRIRVAVKDFEKRVVLSFKNTDAALPQIFRIYNYVSRSGDYMTGPLSIGDHNNTEGNLSFAQGTSCLATGAQSHAHGETCTASGKNSTAFGYGCVASGEDSTAFGYGCVATNKYAVAGGTYARATAFLSLAFGNYIVNDDYIGDYPGNQATANTSVAIGTNNIASGKGSFALGYQNQATGNLSFAFGEKNASSGDGSLAIGASTSATLLAQFVAGINNIEESGDPNTIGTNQGVFIVGNGVLTGGVPGTSSNALRLTRSGDLYVAGTVTPNGADYAETVEWADGNPNNEDRVGKFVVLDHNKMRLATSQDNKAIMGVISSRPSVVGDAAESYWRGKYQTDVYGRIQYQTIEIPEETDGEGNVITPARVCETPILAEEFNSELTYVPRLQRNEYDCFAMLGKLIVEDDGTCEAGGFCFPNDNAIATASQDGFYVMERLDENHIKIFVR